VAVLSWVALLLADNFSFFSDNEQIGALINHTVRELILNIFILAIFLFYKLTIGDFEEGGFTDLLWKSFATGFIVTWLLLPGVIVRQTFLSELSWLPNTFFYHIIIALITIFASVNFFTFKKMILYQKSKEIGNLWRIFEYLIYFSLTINFFVLKNTDILFDLACIPLIVMGVILALNLKWIAYLNFKQKWISILYLTLLLISNFLFIWSILRYSAGYTLPTNLVHNLFTISMLGFISLYCIFSILVLIFNLPTSSVFEQKFNEVLNFQKLSNTSKVGRNEAEVYTILIESCCSTFVAKAAALEIYDTAGNPKNIVYQDLNKDSFYAIKTFLRKNNLKVKGEYLLIEDFKRIKHTENIDGLGFNSLLAMPLESYGEKIGVIYLLSELKNGFEKEMITIVNTYVGQATTSISNYRLINQAVDNARYKEELEIARKVQASLLPSKMINTDQIKILAFSESADEVGGDYYDYLNISDKKIAIVIGDVSGKGTSAAFQMAQLKGVFHSLMHINSSTDKFMEYANKALSACLEKSSFVTLTVLIIDLENKLIETSRAGHCPTLYYNSETKEAVYLQQKGMGLGILRDDRYKQFIGKESLQVKAGDKLMLITDGIIEAVNENGEEMGYDRLKDFLQSNSNEDVKQMKQSFKNFLYGFCGSNEINDDHTALFVSIH
jgi:sigma-B regulation protein RsbU (phosphoserine phosphatase)